MLEINRIMMKEAAMQDCKSIRTDSTVIETDIHSIFELIDDDGN